MAADHSRVLAIVEDQADIRLLVRVNLELDPRIQVDGEASSAEEAYKLCEASQPGLIILDHMLEGGVTGIEAASHLKRIAPDSKILLFSALDLEKEATAHPNIDGFLSKSKIDELLPTAQRLMGIDPGA